jgi:hypothetical protein
VQAAILASTLVVFFTACLGLLLAFGFITTSPVPVVACVQADVLASIPVVLNTADTTSHMLKLLLVFLADTKRV